MCGETSYPKSSTYLPAPRNVTLRVIPPHTRAVGYSRKPGSVQRNQLPQALQYLSAPRNVTLRVRLSRRTPKPAVTKARRAPCGETSSCPTPKRESIGPKSAHAQNEGERESAERTEGTGFSVRSTRYILGEFSRTSRGS